MTHAMRTSIILTDMPVGESLWVATFQTESTVERVERLTHAEAQEWLEGRTRAWLAERLIFAAPDGNGVVVTPPAGVPFTRTVPALAVRVRESSPLLAAPHIAAQITERVHYAKQLLKEAHTLAGVRNGSSMRASIREALEHTEVALVCLDTDVYSVAVVEPVTAPERALHAVRDADAAGGVA